VSLNSNIIHGYLNRVNQHNSQSLFRELLVMVFM